MMSSAKDWAIESGLGEHRAHWFEKCQADAIEAVLGLLDRYGYGKTAMASEVRAFKPAPPVEHKECPFCGGAPRCCKWLLEDSARYKVDCTNERCPLDASTAMHITADEAWRAWDTRA